MCRILMNRPSASSYPLWWERSPLYVADFKRPLSATASALSDHTGGTEGCSREWRSTPCLLRPILSCTTLRWASANRPRKQQPYQGIPPYLYSIWHNTVSCYCVNGIPKKRLKASIDSFCLHSILPTTYSIPYVSACLLFTIIWKETSNLPTTSLIGKSGKPLQWDLKYHLFMIPSSSICCMSSNRRAIRRFLGMSSTNSQKR